MGYRHSLSSAPETNITIKLFVNVKNIPELRKQIINGSLECSLIKPALIIHPFQIVVAANKAFAAEKITTKTYFTEILFNLSPSSNITQSLQKFGVDDSDKNVVVVTIENSESSNKSNRVWETIDGEEVNVVGLKDFTDLELLKKTYGISDVEFEKLSIIDSVVSRIAAKGCA